MKKMSAVILSSLMLFGCGASLDDSLDSPQLLGQELQAKTPQISPSADRVGKVLSANLQQSAIRVRFADGDRWVILTPETEVRFENDLINPPDLDERELFARMIGHMVVVTASRTLFIGGYRAAEIVIR